jgi:hypothetical protein
MVMKQNITDRIIQEIRSILITEAKHTDIIVNTIGLPTEISDWITESYPEKFQLWFANNFKKEAVERIAGNKEVVANIMFKMLKGDSTQESLKKQLLRQKGYFQGAFRHISDWLRGRREIAPETDEINFKTLTFSEAVSRADAWQEAVRRLQAGSVVDESGKIIQTYPDGFYWIDLQKSSCGQEARAMGHCGNASGILYSLRKNKQPSLTGDVYRGSLIQLRGKANTKPKAEYHDKIVDFLLNDKVGINSMNPSSYRPEQNFELKDLDLNQLNRLYQAKPRMFVPEELYKVLLKYPNFAQQVNFRVTPLEEDHKEQLGRMYPEIKGLFGR